MSFLAVLVGFLILVAAGCLFGYLYSRSMFRDQKNFERGLKMVPVLIHLPPSSEDSDGQGRDERDMIDENVSKAQTLYSILASTFQKGIKHRLYGQRHVGFEVIASHGNVEFYAAVPVPMLGVVEQAIVSAYPSATLEEVVEHNIFSPVGRLTGTLGGELRLKENYAYPIATFQDLKRDTMQSVLNALSTLTKDDGAGIQILMRPANPNWRRKAAYISERKRKGDKLAPKGVEGIFWGISQVFTALIKPPDKQDGSHDSSSPEGISGLDQSIVQAIEEKTKQPGFDVMIRVVASSNVTHRAQTILNNLVATFALFDAPGRNGFKFVPAKDIESFVTAYILRFFPPENSRNVLNTIELATLFHFPDQKNIPTSQLERQASKQVDGPRNMPEDGLLLGYNMFRGVKKPIRLSENDRRRHLYTVGQTGTGKSVFLKNLAVQDMLAGNGFAFIDPHGDAVEDLLAMVPRERTEDIVYFSPGEMDYPMGLNMFEYHNPDQKDFLIQETINMLYKLYDPGHTGIIGPRYEHLFRNAALAIMADPNGGTFVDIPKLFRDPAYVQQKLKYVTDQNVLEFWNKEMPQSQRSNEFGDVVSWFVSKFGAFLSNEMMRNIIGQTKSAFDLREIMDDGKILLVNLSRGRVGDLNSKLLGMIFVMKFEAAAMSRADVPEEYRKDFCLYVDEFQNYSTDSFADILSEARKYRLNLIVANQFTTQLTDEVRDAVFGNVGSVVSFRVGTNDAEFLTKQFQPVFDIDDLQFIPNYNTVVRMMIGGVPMQPFSMATIPPLGNPNPQLAEALKQLSAAKFGRPRAQVEAEIFERLKTQPKLPPAGGAFGGRPSLPSGSPFDQLGMGSTGSPFPQSVAGALPPSSAGPKPPSSGSSFLDEWMAKRKVTGSGPSAAGRATAPAGSPNPFSPPAALPPAPSPIASPPAFQPPTPTAASLAPAPQSEPTEFRISREDDGSKASQQESQSLHIDKDGSAS